MFVESIARGEIAGKAAGVSLGLGRGLFVFRVGGVWAWWNSTFTHIYMTRKARIIWFVFLVLCLCLLPSFQPRWAQILRLTLAASLKSRATGRDKLLVQDFGLCLFASFRLCILPLQPALGSLTPHRHRRQQRLSRVVALEPTAPPPAAAASLHSANIADHLRRQGRRFDFALSADHVRHLSSRNLVPSGSTPQPNPAHSPNQDHKIIPTQSALPPY